MECSPEKILEILNALKGYGIAGVVVFFLIFYKEAVIEFIKTILSWFRK